MGAAERMLFFKLQSQRYEHKDADYEMELLNKIYNSKDEKAYCSESDSESQMFEELEACGFIVGKKVTTHAYDDTYAYTLTNEGLYIVEQNMRDLENAEKNSVQES